MSLGFYSKRQLLDLWPISATTLWREIKRGHFPEPVSITPGRVGWPRGVVDEILEKKAGGGNARAA